MFTKITAYVKKIGATKLKKVNELIKKGKKTEKISIFTVLFIGCIYVLLSTSLTPEAFLKTIFVTGVIIFKIIYYLYAPFSAIVERRLFLINTGILYGIILIAINDVGIAGNLYELLLLSSFIFFEVIFVLYLFRAKVYPWLKIIIVIFFISNASYIAFKKNYNINLLTYMEAYSIYFDVYVCTTILFILLLVYTLVYLKGWIKNHLLHEFIMVCFIIIKYIVYSIMYDNICISPLVVMISILVGISSTFMAKTKSIETRNFVMPVVFHVDLVLCLTCYYSVENLTMSLCFMIWYCLITQFYLMVHKYLDIWKGSKDVKIVYKLFIICSNAMVTNEPLRGSLLVLFFLFWELQLFSLIWAYLLLLVLLLIFISIWKSTNDENNHLYYFKQDLQLRFYFLDEELLFCMLGNPRKALIDTACKLVATGSLGITSVAAYHAAKNGSTFVFNPEINIEKVNYVTKTDSINVSKADVKVTVDTQHCDYKSQTRQVSINDTNVSSANVTAAGTYDSTTGSVSVRDTHVEKADIAGAVGKYETHTGVSVTDTRVEKAEAKGSLFGFSGFWSRK